MKSEEEYYAILGLSRKAKTSEIKKAYHKLALLLHPDKCLDKNPQAESKFHEIQHAYETLLEISEKNEQEKKTTISFVKVNKSKNLEKQKLATSLASKEKLGQNKSATGDPNRKLRIDTLDWMSKYTVFDKPKSDSQFILHEVSWSLVNNLNVISYLLKSFYTPNYFELLYYNYKKNPQYPNITHHIAFFLPTKKNYDGANLIEKIPNEFYNFKVKVYTVDKNLNEIFDKRFKQDSNSTKNAANKNLNILEEKIFDKILLL